MIHNSLGVDNITVSDIVGSYFTNVVTEDRVILEARKCQKRKFGITKAYKHLRSLPSIESFPDHVLLGHILDQVKRHLTERSIRKYYFSLLDRGEYNDKEITKILEGIFQK